MRIIFRADASPEIGSGHVMRSSVIAEEAILRGHECVFVGSITGLDWVQNRIDNLGFSHSYQVRNFEHDSETDICVIDSYTEAVNSLFGINDNWRLLVSVKDEFTPNFEADILVVPSLTEEGVYGPSSKILTGGDYILIRKSINKSPVTYPIVEPFKVIVSGGGSDSFRFAEEMAWLIDQLDVTGEFHFFSNNEIFSNTGKNFITHDLGNSIDLIAQNAHAVVTTASTSSLEFIAREIPTGIVSVIDNQDYYYKNLLARELVCGLGRFDSSLGWELSIENLGRFLLDNSYRETLSRKISGLVDLNGAKRVLDSIESFL